MKSSSEAKMNELGLAVSEECFDAQWKYYRGWNDCKEYDPEILELKEQAEKLACYLRVIIMIADNPKGSLPNDVRKWKLEALQTLKEYRAKFPEEG